MGSKRLVIVSVLVLALYGLAYLYISKHRWYCSSLTSAQGKLYYDNLNCNLSNWFDGIAYSKISDINEMQKLLKGVGSFEVDTNGDYVIKYDNEYFYVISLVELENKHFILSANPSKEKRFAYNWVIRKLFFNEYQLTYTPFEYTSTNGLLTYFPDEFQKEEHFVFKVTLPDGRSFEEKMYLYNTDAFIEKLNASQHLLEGVNGTVKISISAEGEVATKMEFPYVDGKANGAARVFVINRDKEFYLLSEFSMSDDFKDGDSIMYHTNGSVYVKGKNLQNASVGNWKYYYASGKLAIDITYNESGYIDGRVTIYDRYGKMQALGRYENGIPKNGTFLSDLRRFSIAGLTNNYRGEYHVELVDYVDGVKGETKNAVIEVIPR